jgi:UDP-3-O-[3-hydroxymyristoyl] glucosamine N-acyltransferase
VTRIHPGKQGLGSADSRLSKLVASAKRPVRSTISPHAYIDDNVNIGSHAIIYPNATILGPCVIGDYVTIASGVIIGADGMEYRRNKQGRLVETVHKSGVIIGNHVDIRANTTVHRGVVKPTVIGDGTKIGPNCNITHEVRIGRHCLITGETTIAGEAKLGDRVYIGPQSVVGTRISIGNDVSIRIGSLVLHDIPDGLTVAGRPAEPIEMFKRHREKLKRLLDDTR